MAASQLKMEGIGDGMTGVAAVFGMPEGLQAQTAERRWISLSALKGRWILVIPDDAHARYRSQFEGVVGGTAIDGRIKSTRTGGFDLVNVSPKAVERLRAAIERMPPLPPAPEPTFDRDAGASEKSVGRVTVGSCTACGRELRVKAHAVRPTLHLTCKCGATNVVTVPRDMPPPRA